MKTILRALSFVAFVSFCSTSALAAPEAFKVAGINFKRPAAWEWVETDGQMRKAQLKISGADKKESADVIFFYFGAGGGGGVQANVDRWFSQFQDAKNKKTDSVTVGTSKVTYVEAEGTYLSGPPGGTKTPMPNHALLGAIVEGAEGSVFIRMAGPTAVTKGAAADFKKMIESGLK